MVSEFWKMAKSESGEEKQRGHEGQEGQRKPRPGDQTVWGLKANRRHSELALLPVLVPRGVMGAEDEWVD